MLPPIEGNPIQLEQVFINLILNAVEAMEQISDRQRLIIISTRLSDNSILITCKDNGNGIPPDMIERIFEPFFSGKTHGMGMGLSISRSSSSPTVARSGSRTIRAPPSTSACLSIPAIEPRIRHFPAIIRNLNKC